MRKTMFVIAILVLAGLATGQGFITTTFASNNGGSSGWMNFFDANIINTSGLKITSLEVNSSAAVATTFSITVYTVPNTYVGNDGNAAVWTQVSTGNGKSNGRDVPTPVDVADFVLQPGKYGIAILYNGSGMAYTNGTGTGPGGNQSYQNPDIALTLGISRTGLFTGSVYSPRVWNGTIYYTPAVTAVLAGTGAGTPGSTYSFSMISPNEPKYPYQLGTALGNGPIPIDTRKIGLTPDGLLVASTGGSLPGIFSGYAGLLDASGRGGASLVLPKIAALKGLRMYTAFVTLKGGAPSGVASISNTHDFLIN